MGAKLGQRVEEPSVVESGPTLASLRRLPLRIAGRPRRVILLPFAHGYNPSLKAVFDLVGSLSEEEVAAELATVMEQFADRHQNIHSHIQEHYALACGITGVKPEHNEARRLLLGAYFTMEYSIEAAALFNPSIVPHPEQTGLDEGALRFVMSFRATGEGHLSSVVFQTGLISPQGEVILHPPRPHTSRTRLAPDRAYHKDLFLRKVGEMGAHLPTAKLVADLLADRFSLPELEQAIGGVRRNGKVNSQYHATFESMLWLARSNYRLQLAPNTDISELLIYPHSDSESRGIEDLRLVSFTDEDGSRYFGTYTAYNGKQTLPMLLETADFRTLDIHTLNGACVQNKGMALFPRRIKGHYAMCSRIDGRNLYIMYSDMMHFWESAKLLAAPKYPWEYRLIGNCGSPLETPEGWLLITHGVGPMRRYCIGAMLLDLDEPGRIRGRLRHPLLTPPPEDRDGYVPNVVYSCGALIYRDSLYLPYAIADQVTSLACVEVKELLDQLLRDGP